MLYSGDFTPPEVSCAFVAIMTESRIDSWNSKEVDLAHRHEELLLRQELLLQGTEAFYNTQESQVDDVITSFSQAEERNQEFLQDLNNCINDSGRGLSNASTDRFNILKQNYWLMVRSMYPEWLEEVREYKQYQQQRRQASNMSTPRGYSPNRTDHSPNTHRDYSTTVQAHRSYSPTRSTPRDHSPTRLIPRSHSPTTQEYSSYSPTRLTPRSLSPNTQAHRIYSPARSMADDHLPTRLTPRSNSPKRQACRSYPPIRSMPRDNSPTRLTPRSHSPTTQTYRSYSPTRLALRCHSPSMQAHQDYSPSTHTGLYSNYSSVTPIPVVRSSRPASVTSPVPTATQLMTSSRESVAPPPGSKVGKRVPTKTSSSKSLKFSTAK